MTATDVIVFNATVTVELPNGKLEHLVVCLSPDLEPWQIGVEIQRQVEDVYWRDHPGAMAVGWERIEQP